MTLRLICARAFLPIAIVSAALVALAPAAHAESLFDNFGQKPGLEKLVASATEIWMHDPRVAPTFEETNMDRFKRMLVEQLCQLTGGGCQYTGHDMRQAHAGLHLGTAQFNALVEDLQAAMDAQSIPFHTQNRLLALLAPMYRDVVTR